MAQSVYLCQEKATEADKVPKWEKMDTCLFVPRKATETDKVLQGAEAGAGGVMEKRVSIYCPPKGGQEAPHQFLGTGTRLFSNWPVWLAVLKSINMINFFSLLMEGIF